MDFQTLNKIRYEAFKNQDQELGNFDVVFDIGGKKLYSNKFMLAPISTTFASMISERWTTKDEPISIETYSYDDFQQFLTFLYSGECQLSNDNIAAMTDIAEFFQVSGFKNVCEEYLSKLEVNLENVIQLLEIVSKYSMDKLKKPLAPFVANNRVKLLNPESFLQISKEVLLQILELDQTSAFSESVFAKVYEWAKKHATAKMESNPNINLEETAKKNLADFIPLFDFGKMDHHFVIKFVVDKSLLPSGPQLSAILLGSCFQTSPANLVKIIDENGKVMKGRFSDPRVFDDIQLSMDAECFEHYSKYIYWTTSFQNRPSIL